MNNFKNKAFEYLFVFLIIIVLFTAIASYFYYKSDNAVGPNLITAFVGVVISAMVTLVLLNGQTKDEEVKERNMKLYNAKLEIYSNFVSSMYEVLRDNQITEEEFLNLRTKLFGQVSFYAKDDILKLINNELREKNYTDTQQMQRCFANIACILQKDLREDWPVNVKSSYVLWDTFDELLDKSHGVNDATETNELSIESTTETVPSDYFNKCFWHFTMWEPDKQLKALREGIYELNLVEYDGIDWRTNLIKQVKKDDLIFLFRSGGWGYMGVYRAVGWRIFEFGENNVCRETLNIFDKGIEEITDQTQIQTDLERSDIYNSRQDGADLCSSIIVEPLAFSSKGIGNPGGVYRRTISRYDHGYGLKQLSRFMAIMDDDSIYNVHFNGEKKVEMGCNKELFKKMLESGNIQPASRDTDGNWK